MANTLDVQQMNESQKAILNLAKEVLDIESTSVAALKERIGESFIRAVEILYQCKGRVIVTGMGKSGIIGKKIAATF